MFRSAALPLAVSALVFAVSALALPLGAGQDARRAAPGAPQRPRPQRAVPAEEPPGFSLRAVMEGATPDGDLREDVRVRVDLDADDAVFHVEDDDAPFRWRVAPRRGHPLAALSIDDEGGRFAPLESAHLLPSDGKVQLDGLELKGAAAVVRYREGLTVRWRARGRTMEIEVSGGFAREVSLGGLAPILPIGARARVLQVPFNDHCSIAVVRFGDGRVRYLTAWFDPVVSNASRIVAREPGAPGSDNEVQFAQVAEYRASTTGELRPLRERIFVTWSDRLLDVLPSQRREASPARAVAGTRFYLDYHRTPFEDAARGLRGMAACGLRDVTVWMRRWQRDGYGAGNPTAVLPPRQAWGGAEGLHDVRRAATEAGFEFALGHNWVFNSEHRDRATALDSDGGEDYWDGGGPRLRPMVAVGLVQPVESALHTTFETRGAFTEALTAVSPTVDLDARNADWGLIREALADWGTVLDTLRAVHGGTIAGDGARRMGNLYWAGAIDALGGQPGMETEADVATTLGVHVPVIPEYRLRRLHPLVVHAGLGDPSEFLNPGGDGPRAGFAPTDRDAMRTLGVVYGLAGYAYVGPQTGVGDVVRDWWSSQATRRHLTDPARRLVDVRYVDGRERWVSIDGLLGQGRVPRVGDARLWIRFEDGTQLWANLSLLPWSVTTDDGRQVLLPTMGRLVVADELESGLVIEGGQVVEYERTATSLWVDGRGGRAAFDGIEVDGAVGLRFDRPGLLEVVPAPDYRHAVSADGGEQRVATARVRIDATWLRERVGDGALDVRAIGLDAESGRVTGLGRVPVELGADGALTLRARDWTTIGASAFLIGAPVGDPR